MIRASVSSHVSSGQPVSPRLCTPERVAAICKPLRNLGVGMPCARCSAPVLAEARHRKVMLRHRKINMHNAGVNGDEAPNESARFKKEVLSFNPALVVWQVGTNAAWKDYFLDDVAAALLRGLNHMSKADTDNMRLEASVLKESPILLQKIIADKLSDKVQIMMVPSDGKFFFANDVFKAAMTNPVMKQEMDSQDDPPAKGGH